ncbi:MAG: lipopolysaccharide heptosyltransferase II [Bacteroidales bacterium]
MNKSVENILLVRLSAIGDIILMSTLIRCLRKQYPSARIDIIVKKQYVSLLEANPHISTIYPLDTSLGFKGLKELKNSLKKTPYDVFLITHKNFRTLYLRFFLIAKKHYTYKKETLKRTLLTELGIDLYNPPIPVFLRYLNTAKKLGVEYDGLRTEFFISPQIRNIFFDRYPNLQKSNRKKIAICPGASFKNKQWLTEYYLELIEKLFIHYEVDIFLLGGKAEEEICKYLEEETSNSVINFAGKLSLQESAIILEMCHVTVVGDTGMLHLSEALGTPVVGIYGPTSEQLGFYPILPQSKVAEVKLKCRPCTKMGLDKCPKKHFRCMKDINPSMVFELIQSIL